MKGSLDRKESLLTLFVVLLYVLLQLVSIFLDVVMNKAMTLPSNYAPDPKVVT